MTITMPEALQDERSNVHPYNADGNVSYDDLREKYNAYLLAWMKAMESQSRSGSRDG